MTLLIASNQWYVQHVDTNNSKTLEQFVCNLVARNNHWEYNEPKRLLRETKYTRNDDWEHGEKYKSVSNTLRDTNYNLLKYK
jgi:hypothetical protein